MRILVTGSAGVIGQTLVPRLLSEGHQVRGFDIRDDFFANVNNSASLRRTFSDFAPDVCIHMAAQVGRLNGEMYPDVSVASNVIGTYRVASECQVTGCRMVNFSTSEVYGHNSEYGLPDILEQNGIYGITKLAAEGIIAHLSRYKGLRAVSVRPFMVYGPHEVPAGEYRSAVSNFIDRAMRDEEIVAHAGCVRSWCYVDDFVDGILLLLEDGPVWADGYRAYCIGTEEYRTMEECASIIIEVVGRGTYRVEEPPEFLVSAVKRADFSDMRALGHTPSVGLEEGIERTYAWMRDYRAMVRP